MNLEIMARQKVSRIIAMLFMVAILGISMAACGGDAATAVPQAPGGAAVNTPAASTGGSGEVQQVDAKLNEWSVTLSNTNLKAGKIQFNVTNEGQFTHDLAVLDNGTSLGATPKFKKGEGPKTIMVDLKPGTYQVICDITGHTEKGMKAEIQVK